MGRAAAKRAKRPRGRPARLSRDAIVGAGLALLERDPEEPLTLARVAEEVGAVPAALYRHVGSHDALLDGVLGRVLQDAHLQIRRRARWPEQVRDWMKGMRAHLLRYPAVLPLIGRRGRTSPAWLDAAAELIAILERAGLREAALARASLWVTETLIGLVLEEAALPFPEQMDAARAVLDEMSEAGRGRVARLLLHLQAIDADAFFDFVVERTLTGLAELVDSGAP